MQIHWKRLVVCVVIAVSLGQSIPSYACIGCDIGKRIGTASQSAIRPVPERSTGFTASWRAPAPPRPAAPRTPRVEASPTRLPRLATPTSGGPSTNRYVDPWGCEARHAQQVSPSGKYWGKYQFDRQTWTAHGGSPGSYGNASEAEQDRVAANVKYDAWPNC